MKTRFGIKSYIAAALVLGVCSTEIAIAGVIDSPLPVINPGGDATKHVFTVPGVLNTTQLATVFQCTSLENLKTSVIAVEVFGAAGGIPLNDVTAGGSSDGSVNVAVGQTVLIATQPLVGQVTADDALSIGAPVRGAARILSTSTKITCAATVMGPGSTPGYLNNLPLLKGKKQHGD